MTQNPEKLRVLKDAQKLANTCFPLLQKLEQDKHFRVKEQLQGSTTSVPACLMEFCSMNSKGAQLEKLRCSIGETNETDSWLDYCVDNGIVGRTEHANLRSMNESVRKQLYGLKRAVEASVPKQ